MIALAFSWLVSYHTTKPDSATGTSHWNGAKAIMFTFLSCILAVKSRDGRLCCGIYLASVLSGSKPPRIGTIGLLCHLGYCHGPFDVSLVFCLCPPFFESVGCWFGFCYLFCKLCLIVWSFIGIYQGDDLLHRFLELLWRKRSFNLHFYSPQVEIFIIS
jgi:hypothetical protein